MKVKKSKYLIMLFLIIMSVTMLFCIGVHVNAESGKERLLVTISSDKENYNLEDEVKLKIIVKNTNDFEVSNIKVENILPDGISLISGDISKDSITLKANEEYAMDLTVKKEGVQAYATDSTTNNVGITEKNTTVSKSEKLPNTGDSNNILIALIAMFISIAVMIFCFWKGRKKHLKILSLFLFLGIASTFVITSIVHASSENNYSFIYEYTYKIDNNDFVHKVVVSYSLQKENNDKNNTDTEKKIQDGYVTDNLAQFKMEDRFDSRMDITKAMMSNTKCEYMHSFNNVIALEEGNKWTYFDKDGKVIIQNCDGFTSNNRVIDWWAGGDWYNYNNNYILPYIPTENYIPVKINGKCGYYDIQGNEVIPCGTFEEVRPVHNELAWVKKDGKWGVIKLVEITEPATTTTESTPTIPEEASTYNGHSYMVYSESMTWKEAKEYCENLGGHLVTISDADEQKFVEDLTEKYTDKVSYWLGGYYSDAEWKWVDDTEFSYTNWDSWTNGEKEYRQPDNFTSDEFYLRFANRKMQYENWYSNKGKWNDIANEADGSSGDVPLNSFGVICEWDSVIQAYKTEDNTILISISFATVVDVLKNGLYVSDIIGFVKLMQ